MADSAEASADPQVSFKVKTSGDRTHSITMSEAATVSDLKAKLAGPDFEDIPIERQRLIYSGRVMKNDEPLSTYKIKTGNTIHLVKSAASNPAPASSTSSSSTPAVPQIPSNMAAGTANNPLAGLTGARYAGLTNLPSADMFGPDGGMSGSMGMSDSDMESMLNNPNFLQQMNEMMNNDAFVQMMESHPAFRSNPAAQQMLRNPEFRRMMLNPETLRSAARMQRMMRGQGGGASAFPMPGATDNTPGSGDASATGGNNAGANSGNAGARGQPNPFDPAMWGAFGAPGAAGGGDAGANPFAAFFNPFAIPGQGGVPGAGADAGAQTQNGSTTTSGDANAGGNTNNASNPSGTPAAANPFASLFGAGVGAGAGAGAGAGTAANPFGTASLNPEALQQMLQMLGVNSPGGGSPAPAPVDNRPPEERYAEQLRQLNDMGFTDFDRNVAALRRSGGSVQGAIEHLLS